MAKYNKSIIAVSFSIIVATVVTIGCMRNNITINVKGEQKRKKSEIFEKAIFM